MNSFLVWLEATAFSAWVRESPSLFAFPAILSMHTVGMGLVAGINSAIALRILGVGPGIPLGEMRRFLPVMWFGFWLNAASGVVLLVGYPTKALTNPDFYLKLTLVGLGLLLVKLISRRVFAQRHGDPAPGPVASVENVENVENIRLLAAASLTCWAGVIITGRLLAYTYRHLMAS
jgi:hypothetical protein